MTETPTQQSSESTTPRPKRRWLQFNLRTLLVLTLVVGSGLGWVASERQKNAKRQADIDALEKFGCRSIFFLDGYFRPSRFDWLLARKDFGVVTSMLCEGTTITDAGLEHLSDLTSLEFLRLTDTKITGSGLGNLNKLTKLIQLDLNNTAITDAGLEHLRRLNLSSLNLDGTAITDAGLVHLKGLRDLRHLDLPYTPITDAGLIHLKGMTNLIYLDFRYTAITDAGLEHLKGLEQLSKLDLRGAKTTNGGVAELQKALPNCEIKHGE